MVVQRIVRLVFVLGAVLFCVASIGIAHADAPSALKSPTASGAGYFGYSMATGRINGDLTPDLVVGAPGELSRRGRVHIFDGVTRQPIMTLTQPSSKACTLSPCYLYFGVSVAVADVSGDGVNDVIVGAPGRLRDGAGVDSGRGRVFVFNGPDGALMRTLTSPAGTCPNAFGLSVAAGDVDADGRKDVIVGAPDECPSSTPATSYGRVFVFSAATGAMIWEIRPAVPQARSQFGFSVAAVPSMFSSAARVLVGAPNEDVGTTADQGKAYVFTKCGGNTCQQTIAPSSSPSCRDGHTGCAFGYAVAAIKPSPNEDYGMVVGAPNEDLGGMGDAGKVYIFSSAGALLRTLRSPQVVAGCAGQCAGFGSALMTGDTTGDASQELAVGAPFETYCGCPFGSFEGNVYLFSATGSLIQSYATPAPAQTFQPEVLFGSALAIADLDRDKCGDVLAGAYRDDGPTLEADGTVYVYRAQTLWRDCTWYRSLTPLP